MSAPVDMLAQEIRSVDGTHSLGAAGLAEALMPFIEREFIPRSAMAELIDAANRAAIAACRGDGSHPGTIRNADLDALRAALARIGDAA